MKFKKWLEENGFKKRGDKFIKRFDSQLGIIELCAITPIFTDYCYVGLKGYDAYAIISKPKFIKLHETLKGLTK